MGLLTDSSKSYFELKGIPASKGIAIGPAYIFDNENFWIEEKNIDLDLVDEEKRRFSVAVEKVIKEIKAIQRKLVLKVGEENASIFDSHIMLLQDPAVIDETHKIIDQGKSAEFAFFRTARMIIKAFKRVDDEYMKERITDIKDILKRVTTVMMGKELVTLSNITTPVVVVAPTLNPSDTAHMNSEKVLGIITDTGGQTSHATILSRALAIPAVLSVKTASSDITQGDMVIVDGNTGEIFVNPPQETIEKYKKLKIEIEEDRRSLSKLKDLPSVTTDNVHIGLHANIEFTNEVHSVIEHGAEGVGLYRSEFHYLREDQLPNEEDQYQEYIQIAKGLAPKPLIIRTLDLGGDKMSHIFPYNPEANPFLGWRAIRISLSQQDMFKSQLRAILRASKLKNMSVMFPMISCMEELDETLSILEKAKTELTNEKIEFDPDMRVGVMIELPSAVMIADHLARKVDFFSIGTNDLIQYTMAVDRSNDRIADLFEPFHPGIIKLMKLTADAAHANGIPVAVCGEMSGDPASALILIGLGMDELSMVPSFIPTIKNLVRGTSLQRMKEAINRVLECSTAEEVKTIINAELEMINNNG